VPNYTRSLRGDVKIILNRMIRDGTIASFEANFHNPASLTFSLHIRVSADLGVAPGTGVFNERRRELRDRILGELQPISAGVTVTVRDATAAASNDIKRILCRQARELLGWTRARHAKAAGVGSDVLARFERGERATRPEAVAAILSALTAAGIEFTGDGVQLKPEALKQKQ
jgi:hypothetical protein